MTWGAWPLGPLKTNLPWLKTMLDGGCGEIHLLVQIGEGELRPDGLQVERVFHAGGGSEQPAAIGLAGIQLGAHALRGNQQVLADRLDGAVVLELAAAVVGLGGRREHFDDQAGIEQRIARIVEELRLTANHNRDRKSTRLNS